MKKAIGLTTFVMGVVAPQLALAQDATESAGEAPSGFLGIIFAGGWIGAIFIFVLLALSFVMAYLIFDHLMTIRRKDLMPEEIGRYRILRRLGFGAFGVV